MGCSRVLEGLARHGCSLYFVEMISITIALIYTNSSVLEVSPYIGTHCYIYSSVEQVMGQLKGHHMLRVLAVAWAECHASPMPGSLL